MHVPSLSWCVPSGSADTVAGALLDNDVDSVPVQKLLGHVWIASNDPERCSATCIPGRANTPKMTCPLWRIICQAVNTSIRLYYEQRYKDRVAQNRTRGRNASRWASSRSVALSVFLRVQPKRRMARPKFHWLRVVPCAAFHRLAWWAKVASGCASSCACSAAYWSGAMVAGRPGGTCGTGHRVPAQCQPAPAHQRDRQQERHRGVGEGADAFCTDADEQQQRDQRGKDDRHPRRVARMVGAGEDARHDAGTCRRPSPAARTQPHERHRSCPESYTLARAGSRKRPAKSPVAPKSTSRLIIANALVCNTAPASDRI